MISAVNAQIPILSKKTSERVGVQEVKIYKKKTQPVPAIQSIETIQPHESTVGVSSPEQASQDKPKKTVNFLAKVLLELKAVKNANQTAHI